MDVKERFANLRDKKESLTKSKMEYEVRLESLKKQISDALTELYTKYNVKSLEEAKKKYNETEQQLVKDLEEMEKQLSIYEESVKDIEV